MTAPSGELTAALQRFGQLFDAAAIDARQAHSPATIYTPAVVVWLMVDQRLRGNASLETAVGELLRMARSGIPPHGVAARPKVPQPSEGSRSPAAEVSAIGL